MSSLNTTVQTNIIDVQYPTAQKIFNSSSKKKMMKVPNKMSGQSTIQYLVEKINKCSNFLKIKKTLR